RPSPHPLPFRLENVGSDSASAPDAAPTGKTSETVKEHCLFTLSHASVNCFGAILSALFSTTYIRSTKRCPEIVQLLRRAARTISICASAKGLARRFHGDEANLMMCKSG